MKKWQYYEEKELIYIKYIYYAMNFDNKQKSIFGKIFLALSFLMLGYMLVSPLSQVIFHIDEHFTISILKFPIADLINITANDVHPPLYYLIAKIVSSCLGSLGMNSIFIYKLASLLPYGIILLFSVTKIKREYGYLTAGLFSFSLAVMSEFFQCFLLIRMYSWAMLFVLLAFIYLKDVLDTNSAKSWFLLTIFSVLAAYTHYFAAISLVCVYLLLFIYFILMDTNKLKEWAISVLVALILYSPWFLTLMNQLRSVHNSFWIPEITLTNFITFLGYFSYVQYMSDVGNLVFSLIAVIILAIIIHLYYKQVTATNGSDNFYIFCGIFVYLGTIVIGSLVSILFKPILIVRYLLISSGVLWFVISIMINKIENKKEFLISFILVLILLLSGTGQMISSNNELAHYHLISYFDQIDQDDNSMLIIAEWPRSSFFHYSDITDMYLLDEPYYICGESLDQFHQIYNFKEVSIDKLHDLINQNQDKNIYFIATEDFYTNNNIFKIPISQEGKVIYSKIP